MGLLKPRLGLTVSVILSLVVALGFVNAQRESKPHEDVVFTTPIPALQKYAFRRVWVPAPLSWLGIKPSERPRLVAVHPDGDTFSLPDEFPKILRREGLMASSPAEALDLALTYVRLTVPIGSVLVLSELALIPGIDRNPPKTDLTAVVASPTVQRSGREYLARLFTWRALGGVIEQWTITLGPDASLRAHSNQLATHVGDAIGLQ